AVRAVGAAVGRVRGGRALPEVPGAEGTSGMRAHLAACPSCRERLAALAGELALVRTALTTGPTPRVTRQRPAPVLRWAPVLAAAVLVLAVGLGRSRLGGSSPIGPQEAAAAPELAVVSEALFTDDELTGGAAAGAARRRR